MESISDASGNLDTCKQQGKQIIKKLDQRSPTKCSIEAGAYTFQYAVLRFCIVDAEADNLSCGDVATCCRTACAT